MDVQKKRLALFCAILLLLVALTSCGTKTEKPKSTETATTNREEDQTEEIRNDVDDLPDDLDFQQHTIRLFSYVQSETVREMLQEESEVNVVQDAMFKRNLNLEDRLNCRIEVYERVGDTNSNFITDEITNLINGGFDTYNIMTTAGYRMCAMAQLGHFANLLDLPFINTEKDYYSQGYNDALSVGNAQYLLTGQFSLSYYRYMIGMFFNKNLFTDAGVEYPYQTVLNGDWDFHEVAELSANFYIDLNGQGDVNVDDQFGYVMWAGSGSSLTDGYMASAGLRVVGKDGENFYVSDLSSTSNFSNAIDHILEMMYSEGSYTSSTYFDVVGKFTAGTAALTSFRLFFLEETGMKNLGDTKQGYGILPLPKSDSETQDEYYSYIQDQCLLYAKTSKSYKYLTETVGCVYVKDLATVYAAQTKSYHPYPKFRTELGLMQPDGGAETDTDAIQSFDRIFLAKGHAEVSVFGVAVDECTLSASDHFPLFADVTISNCNL